MMRYIPGEDEPHKVLLLLDELYGKATRETPIADVPRSGNDVVFVLWHESYRGPHELQFCRSCPIQLKMLQAEPCADPACR